MLRLVEAVVGQLGALLAETIQRFWGTRPVATLKGELKGYAYAPWGSLGLVQSIYSKGITTMMMLSRGRCSWLDFSFVVGDFSFVVGDGPARVS